MLPGGNERKGGENENEEKKRKGWLLYAEPSMLYYVVFVQEERLVDVCRPNHVVHYILCCTMLCLHQKDERLVGVCKVNWQVRVAVLAAPKWCWMVSAWKENK